MEIKHRLTSEEVLAEFAKHPKWEELVEKEIITSEDYLYAANGRRDLIERIIPFLDWLTQPGSETEKTESFIRLILQYPGTAKGEIDFLRLFDHPWGFILFTPIVRTKDYTFPFPDFVRDLEVDSADVWHFCRFINGASYTWGSLREKLEYILENRLASKTYEEAIEEAAKGSSTRSTDHFILDTLAGYRELVRDHQDESGPK